MNYFQQIQNQESNYQPPQQPQQQQIYQLSTTQPASSIHQIHLNGQQADFPGNYQYSNSVPQSTDQQFDDFQEDQVTKRIRLQQQKIQTLLKSKSQNEWNLKQSKKQAGKHQLQDFLNKKQEQKVARAALNIHKQRELREDIAKLNIQANWRKVITNINLRIGERKGTKDVNRMREAILHKREDEGK